MISSTPRENNLYRKLAKDYKPKDADMLICKYIEAMQKEYDGKFAEFEARFDALATQKEEEAKTTRTRKPKTETTVEE